MSGAMRVNDYPLLADHGSDLRECARDERESGASGMIAECGSFAICLDDIMGGD